MSRSAPAGAPRPSTRQLLRHVMVVGGTWYDWQLLGDERWEIVWIEPGADGRVAILKRPAVSLLSKIPLSQLGRLLMGGGGDGGQ